MNPKNTAERDIHAQPSLTDAIDHRYRYRILLALTRDRVGDGIVIGRPASEADDGEPDVLVQQLYDEHLPTLADAELVDWDAETGIVTRGRRFDETRPVRRVHLAGDGPRRPHGDTDV